MFLLPFGIPSFNPELELGLEFRITSLPAAVGGMPSDSHGFHISFVS